MKTAQIWPWSAVARMCYSIVLAFKASSGNKERGQRTPDSIWSNVFEQGQSWHSVCLSKAIIRDLYTALLPFGQQSNDFLCHWFTYHYQENEISAVNFILSGSQNRNRQITLGNGEEWGFVCKAKVTEANHEQKLTAIYHRPWKIFEKNVFASRD